MWVDLAQIVSASAVTLTLLAVIMTIRQNTRSQKAVAVDSLAAAITSINVPAMKSHYPQFCAVQGDCGLGFRQPRRTNHRALFSVFLFQAFRERLVSAESGHPRSGAMDWMGNVASKVLSRRWSASRLVAGSQGCVLPGISKVSLRDKTG
jgi:hypothetical protein